MEVEPDSGLCIWNGSGGADQRRSGGSAYLLRRPGPQTSGAGIDGAFDPYHDHGQPDLAPVGAAGPKQGRPLPVSVPAGTGCQLGARQTPAPFLDCFGVPIFGRLVRAEPGLVCGGGGEWIDPGPADSGSGGGVRSQVLGKGRRDSQ